MEIDGRTITCCHKGCGISFTVPAHWVKKRLEDHTFWYCPNGHKQHFAAETEADKLRRERDRLAQQVAQRDDAISHQREIRQGVERRLSATKGVVTRIKNRVGHGVCPCCTRTFQNLNQHMKNQHPDYANASVPEATE